MRLYGVRSFWCATRSIRQPPRLRPLCPNRNPLYSPSGLLGIFIFGSWRNWTGMAQPISSDEPSSVSALHWYPLPPGDECKTQMSAFRDFKKPLFAGVPAFQFFFGDISIVHHWKNVFLNADTLTKKTFTPQHDLAPIYPMSQHAVPTPGNNSQI